MSVRKTLGVTVAAALLVPIAVQLPALGNPTNQGSPDPGAGQYIVRAANPATAAGEVALAGAAVEVELEQLGAVTATLDAAQARRLAANPTLTLARSGRKRLSLPEGSTEEPTASRPKGRPAFQADPATSLDGLFWQWDRLRVEKAQKVTLGSSDVVIGVVDTGLDFSHSELAGKIAGQIDFTQRDGESLCKQAFGYDDNDAALEFGGPPNTDWNGHGTWVGGAIAASADGVGINGLAPNITLFDLKVAGWCGYATDAALIAAIVEGADAGMDILTVSFGGYADRSDPEQDAIYEAYVDAVAYAKSKGTLVVSSAGNDHVRIGAGGRVLSHGSLTVPGDDVVDLNGLWAVPGGVPGVVMVSATNNSNNAVSGTCTPESVSAGACKPATDAHRPARQGKRNQLAYYSNYGPRVDVAAPGGARKYNLPFADGGGTLGFPETGPDFGTETFGAFSITSNWSLDFPCYVFEEGPFHLNECYSTVQGTSMATPYVASVVALIATQNPDLRNKPDALKRVLKSTARSKGLKNLTPPLSASDTSPGDLNGVACLSGYCHLGGPPISAAEAYGAGLVDAHAAVRA